MDRHTITMTPKGGGEFETTTEIAGNAYGESVLADWIKKMPPKQRVFFKECRVKAVIPVYLPKGDFEAHETALTLDRDQLKWMCSRYPQFSAVDETRNNHLSTGGKIISIGGESD